MGSTLPATTTRDAPAMAAPESWSELVRVTIVDDSEEFVALMGDVLGQRFGVTGLVPRTIDELAATDPQLVFVDAFVRDDGLLGGWELIDRARRDPRLREVPVILCTGEIEPHLDRLSEVAGVHLLSKPFDLDILERTMRRAMADGA
jgi:CheY-like chemotaxis protein